MTGTASTHVCQNRSNATDRLAPLNGPEPMTSMSKVPHTQQPATQHDEYKDTILSFQDLTITGNLYYASHYRPIARLLHRRSASLGSQSTAANNYDGSPSLIAIKCFGETTNCPQSPLHEWKSSDLFESSWNNLQGNKVVFLRGFASSEILCRLGAKLDLDYEFLYQHYCRKDAIDIETGSTMPHLFPLGQGTVQLAFTSIVVRSFTLHDHYHFSVEQIMTFKLVQTEKSWTVVVWSDFGSSLSQTLGGPWNKTVKKYGNRVSFVPIAMPYSNTVIRDHIALANDKNGQASDFDGELLQSATFIPQEFSKHIDHNVASRNPFYAMDGIFRTFAASEQQFINLMADLIDNIASKGPEEGVMIELQHIYRCLQRHEERLQDTFEVLRGKGGRGWFRLEATTDSRKQKADDALQDLMHIFEKLLRRVSTVSTACKGEMEMLKHEAMFEETQKTIAQAEGLSKITAIAFVFVPLSFVTSFFGMNFPEIGAPLSGLRTGPMAIALSLLVNRVVVWKLDNS
ncbi:hypothetical protein S7711_11064 [Stachybotrys chartarum IBT 7711]|uniref:Uncharacterized protein n=1 Tax=Stachybotrys chartarum (strain CBS 109288 / IBT 7711) TaxID=1280523 RepID=A0A084BB37_STACB|nr:hypothetical protein S7711_11064 [Stachybotrys chartarum IBT 7711]